MKSMQFRRKDSVLRVVPEKKPTPKKKTNVDRLIYFVVLAVLGTIAVVYVVNKFFFIHAQGQVLLDNVMVRLADDSRLLKFYKQEGATVHAGDSLFMYFMEEPLSSQSKTVSSTSTEESGDKDNWIVREKFRIDTKIEMNKSEIDEKRNLLYKSNPDLQRVKNLVMLDALPYSRLESLQKYHDELTADLGRLNAENEQLQTLADNLNNANTGGDIQSLLQDGKMSGLLGTAKVFYSPVDGTVNRIFRNEFETALKSEDIMSVQQTDRIFIKAYFNPSDVDYFKQDDLVNLTFPNGSKTKGIIKRLYLGTYPMPVEFQKKYEPTRRTVAADIYPLSENAAKDWVVFHMMDVEIGKFKY